MCEQQCRVQTWFVISTPGPCHEVRLADCSTKCLHCMPWLYIFGQTSKEWWGLPYHIFSLSLYYVYDISIDIDIWWYMYTSIIIQSISLLLSIPFFQFWMILLNHMALKRKPMQTIQTCSLSKQPFWQSKNKPTKAKQNQTEYTVLCGCFVLLHFFFKWALLLSHVTFKQVKQFD